MDERPDASFKSGANDLTARASDGALVRGRAFREKTGAGAADSSEAVRLVCAVAAAVSLGVACGLWLNARLASAAFETTAASARLTTAPDAEDTHKFLTSSPTAEPANDDKGDTPHAADGAVPSTNQDEAARDEGTRNENPRPPVEREERGRGAGEDAGGPAAGEQSASARAVGRNDVRPAAAAARRQDGNAPCAFYASASALTIANGGGATLVLGGPGRQGRVVVTTPDWSDIAVLSEGRADGGGWLRYSVRSVSKRTGAFAVSVKTPCGSLTIPVKVVRP
jgi:hypothetical protein